MRILDPGKNRIMQDFVAWVILMTCKLMMLNYKFVCFVMNFKKTGGLCLGVLSVRFLVWV